MVSGDEVSDEAERMASTEFGIIGNLRDGGTIGQMACPSIGLEFTRTPATMTLMSKQSWPRTSTG